jgi:hypothetical protein
MRSACLLEAQRFTIDRFADEYLALYRQLLERNAAAKAR